MASRGVGKRIAVKEGGQTRYYEAYLPGTFDLDKGNQEKDTQCEYFQNLVELERLENLAFVLELLSNNGLEKFGNCSPMEMQRAIADTKEDLLRNGDAVLREYLDKHGHLYGSKGTSEEERRETYPSAKRAMLELVDNVEGLIAEEIEKCGQERMEWKDTGKLLEFLKKKKNSLKESIKSLIN